MEPEGSLSCSQEPLAGSHPESDSFSRQNNECNKKKKNFFTRFWLDALTMSSQNFNVRLNTGSDVGEVQMSASHFLLPIALHPIITEWYSDLESEETSR
jgi:hypothetical protein